MQDDEAEVWRSWNMTKLKYDGLKLNSCYNRLSCKKFWRDPCNIIMEKTYVNLYIPYNISCLLYPCTICFVVNETTLLSRRRKTPSLLFVHNEAWKFSSFFKVFPHCRSIYLFCVVWWWWFYICLNECLWMQMTWCNVSCKWMFEDTYETIITNLWCLFFGFTAYFSVYQRWLFAVSLP